MMTKLGLELSRELKLIAITYFSVVFTITLSNTNSLTLKSLLSVFLNAFGSIGILPLAGGLWSGSSYTQNNLILDYEAIITSVLLSLFATLGTILSIAALCLIDCTLGLTFMPEGFIKTAIPLGVAIALLNTTKLSIILYPVIPSMLAINASLCEERVNTFNKVIVILATIMLSFLMTIFLNVLVKRIIILLCIMPLVILAFLRNKNVKEFDKKNLINKDIVAQEKCLEKTKSTKTENSEKNYKKIYLIKLAS